MANSVIESKIPVATPGKTKLDLSCDHITTMMFGEAQPVHYRHPLKGEHLNLRGIGKIRPFPMAAPTFGRMRCNIHHFYVPWRLVFPQYESMYNDTIAVNYQNTSLIQDAPSITNDKFVSAFTSTSTWPLFPFLLTTVLPTANTVYDFKDASGTKYKFTKVGKYMYKVLTGLGYAINWDMKDTAPLSALPILAYCKVLLDYYANQAYLDDQFVLEIKKILSYNDPSTSLSLSVNQLVVCLYMMMHTQYEQDYFVGAWDNPFAPNSNQYSAITFQDIARNQGDSIGAFVTNQSSLSYPNAIGQGTPMMKQPGAGTVTLGTQFLHDALKVITDYSKRHQLAGATNIARTLAQFGSVPVAMRLDRAYHLEGSSIDIDTGAVFSTANTAQPSDPSSLGDYAGNGIGNGVTDFDYVVEEFGIQISIASIMPSAGLVQGIDENNMHVNRYDFFIPEFDGLGTQAIRKREVYVSNDGAFGQDANNQVAYDKAFGWTGRYGEYKRPKSWLSGDFRCPTRFLGSDAWHLFRMFDDTYWSTITNVVHSNFFTMLFDNEQFRRIFTMTDTDNDPFYAEFHWAVGSYAPCHGLFETYEFETDDNKKVTLQGNGSLVN